ncbi:uncharacterized protein [Watersipora subatra]|uniref:uncharacterized protein n=1 Tax=Watersipora subatra TaxID=2589382 RepID=UPI00355BE22A
MATASNRGDSSGDELSKETEDVDWDRKYEVRYRHSGEDEPEDWGPLFGFKNMNVKEILDDIKPYHITHLYCRRDIPPLGLISPRLNTLDVRDLHDPSQWERLSQLSHLEILKLSSNDFSEGLPEVICNLTSLKSLDVDRCEISQLPERRRPDGQKVLDLIGQDPDLVAMEVRYHKVCFREFIRQDTRTTQPAVQRESDPYNETYRKYFMPFLSKEEQCTDQTGS